MLSRSWSERPGPNRRARYVLSERDASARNSAIRRVRSFSTSSGCSSWATAITLPPASAARNASAPRSWALLGPAAAAGPATDRRSIQISALTAIWHSIRVIAAAIITGVVDDTPTVKVVSLPDIGRGTQFTDYWCARPWNGLHG